MGGSRAGRGKVSEAAWCGVWLAASRYGVSREPLALEQPSETPLLQSSWFASPRILFFLQKTRKPNIFGVKSPKFECTVVCAQGRKVTFTLNKNISVKTYVSRKVCQ